MAFASTFSTRIIATVLFSTILFSAQAQQTTFRIQYNLGEFDIPSGMVQNPAGNYVFSATVTRNFSGLPLGVQGGLTEVDQNGNNIRSQLFRSGAFTSDADLADVKNATGGGYIVTGSSGGQCLLARLSNTFGITWQYRYIPVSGARAFGSKVIQTTDGGFLVVGSASRVDPDGAGAIARQDSSKMFCFKTDASGTISWMRTFFYTTAFDDDDFLNDAVEVSDGYVLVGSAAMTGNDGQSDAVVLKLNISGTLQWARRFGNSNEESINSVIRDSGNDIVMSGLDNLGAFIYNWSAPNSAPSVIGTNSRYTTAGIPVQAGSLTKTLDNQFAVFGSGVSFNNFTSIIFKANRSTGAVLFARSYNSFISILPTGIQAADSGYLMNSLSADTTGSLGFYDFGVTKTDVNGTQGIGATCPHSNATFVRDNYSPSINTFTPTIVTTNVRNSGGLTTASITPGVVVACRIIQCSPKPATPTVSANPTTICSGQSAQITATGGSNVTYKIYTQANGGTSIGNAPFTVSPITNTIYYVEADDNTNPGCVSATRGSVQVIVNQPPANVGVISGAAAPCPSSQNYTVGAVSGATSVVWSVTNGGNITSSTNTSATINWTGTGNQTITVTATNTCGTKTNTLAVNVQAGPPTGGSITGNNNPCPGNQQYTMGGVTGATTYSWQLSGGGTVISGGSTATVTIDWTTAGGPYTLTATASNSCGQVQRTYTVNVKNGTPISVGTITGPIAPCPGVHNYSINNVAGSTGYTWAISGGGNITGGQNTTNATIAWTVAGPHTITVTATNDCGSANNTLQVNVKTAPPTSVPPITGTNNVCPGTQTYSITPVANASNYVWSVNNGGTITSGQGTTSININWTTPGGLYTVSVVASNDCGNASNTLSINVQNAAPIAPTLITGDTAVCAGTKAYTIAAVNNAITYTWSISGGGTISSGQGTTNININWTTAGTYTVSATAGNSCGTSNTTVKTVTVTEAAPTGLGSITGTQVVCKGNYNYTVGAATNGTTYNWTVGSPGTLLSGQGTTSVSVNWKGTGTFPISVSAQNVCGSSANTSLNVTVSDTTPTPPITITGNNQPCPGATTYTIQNSANATGYTWTVSAGGTILSGQGTTSINVDWATVGGPYTVAVSADNICGSSVKATLQVTVLNGSAPIVGNITGDTAVCPSTTTYSIAPVQDANGYQWTVTNGTINSGQGTISISVTWATPGNATVNVVATGSCSNSLTKTINVRVKADKPGRPGSIIGLLSTCGSTSETYTISSVPNATNYSWGISGGGTITSGQGTTSITVNWASSPGTYTLSVFAENDCGQSTLSTLDVTVNPPAPVMSATIQGSNDVCPGLNNYTITAIPNATGYTWTVSNGGTIVSGQGTTSLTVNWTTAGAQTVSVTATNACGTSSPATLSVNVKVAPTVPTATAKDATICEGSNTVLTGTNSLGGTVSYNFYDAETGGNLVGVSPLTVSPVTTTTYYLESVNEFGCRHSGTRVPAIVTVVKAPTVLNLSTNNTSICYGDSATLSATASQGATIVWWDAPLNGNQLGTGTTLTTDILFETTSFFVSATSTGGCKSLEARKEITVEVKSLPIVTLTSDKLENKILPQEKLVFTANPNGYAKYEFYVNGTLVQEGPENFYASSKFNDKDTVVVVALDNGCRSVADTAIVKVSDFPNAFTPNKDGRNDVFLKDYDLVIYNRWGQELYKGIEGWDGTYNGKKVSPGTYFYIVELENITDKNTTVKGTVLLIQE